MAAYLKQENGKDAPKTVIFDGSEVNLYEPTIKQLTIMRAGANRSQWESFLTLGFGGSGSRPRGQLESEPAGHREHGWDVRWPSLTWCRCNRRSWTCSRT